ncbi:hypothetical protein JT359_00445 [Candidatus Poribacteria bacterium]|nr:hypothetical protein [Candidatus Poribacteria bacterium]
MQKNRWLIVVALIGSIFIFGNCNKTQQIQETVIVEIEPSEIVVYESPEDVLIFIGKTWWISPENARTEAELTKELLEAKGIQVGITGNEESLRDWMLQTTANNSVNVCILNGVLPTAIYPAGNTQPDGSIAEKWIESTDGDTILNQADYLGYNTTEGKANERGALQNLMDIEDIEIDVYTHDTIMVVSESAGIICPSLTRFESDRPFPLDQLEDDWYAEKIFATDTGNAKATVADPIIVRDGNRGRIAIVYHTQNQNNPKAEVASEIISNYLIVK